VTRFNGTLVPCTTGNAPESHENGHVPVSEAVLFPNGGGIENFRKEYEMIVL
jgi:hypothetical protein